MSYIPLLFLTFFLTGCAHLNTPQIKSEKIETEKAKSQPVAALSPTITPQQEAIRKLNFLIGNWSGPGISYANDGTQTAYFDTEYVRFDLDQQLLLINAKGAREGKNTYQLHTVIHYDSEVSHYWYTPYSARGARRFKCTLTNQHFNCINEAQDYRLTFQRLPSGEWNEFGERLTSGEWRKNFETILLPASP